MRLKKANPDTRGSSAKSTRKSDVNDPNERCLDCLNIYSRGTLELIDIAKDIYYCVVTPHTNHVLTYFLWVLTLVGVLFSILRILAMRLSTYTQEFGFEEINNEDDKRIKSFCFLKVRRIIREVFYMQQDRDEIEIKWRVARQMMFMGVTKNFPMFFMILWESFDLGYTFGMWKCLSVFLSMWLLQYNSGTYLPYLFHDESIEKWHLEKKFKEYKGAFESETM